MAVLLHYPGASSVCPWLDSSFPGGSLVTGGPFATTSTDGHTKKYCTIEEAMFASSGANQIVHVSEGNWPQETMTRSYSDSPDLTVVGTGDRASTVINGVLLSGAAFDGLTFENLTFAGDHSDGFSNYNVTIDANGTYADLAFVGNVFDGENDADRGAIFSNRGWDGLTVDNNLFTNFENSLARPDNGATANYSLVFLEAQSAAIGNNLTIVNNTVEDVRHLNSFEAYRWNNVNISDNTINGVHGRILVWSNGSATPINNVTVANNLMTLQSGTADYSTIGIGLYFLTGTANTTGNTVDSASSCMVALGVGTLNAIGNAFSNCATRGLLFDEPGGGVEAVSATITGNTFSDSAVGAENGSDDFLLNVCANTFTNVTTPQLENPGPFVDCIGSIVVQKYEDIDGDSTDNGGTDPGIENWEISLFDASDVLIDGPLTTDANGFVSFVDVPLGSYKVCETEATGWLTTDGPCETVEIVNVGDVANISFGNFELGEIIVSKFEDLNQDGIRQNFGDTPEPGLADWQFTISGPNGYNTNEMTGPNGFFTLSDLTAGSYEICEVLQPGWPTAPRSARPSM